MKPKILFLTTAHRFDDDRIFHHQAKELVRHGFEVKICSLSSEFSGELEGISIESASILEQSVSLKKTKFKEIINSFKPHGIIASEPLAILSARDFARTNNCSLIYDITEWYPSMRMLAGYPFPSMIFHFVKFFLIQIYAGFLSSHFIFGEKTKRFPLAYFFPFKPQIILPYFPDERYIFPAVNKLQDHAITLCYTGGFTKEKGIENFLNAADTLRRKRPEIEVSMLLVGSAENNSDANYFTDLLEKYQFENIVIREPSNFEDFTKTLSSADICFDLRNRSFENHHCLPIKLFYYAASGKPVIYTDLKAISQHVDIAKFGFLVNPEDSERIAQHISHYIDHPEVYDQHAQSARSLFEKEYNWNRISELFVSFVRKSLPQK